MFEWPDWFSITPYSAIDLAVFVVCCSLTGAFYLVFWKIGRRRVDLLFSTCLLFLSVMAFGFFIEDNTESPLVAFRWARINYAMLALFSACFVHFCSELINDRRPSAKRTILGVYLCNLIVVAIIFSPYCYRVRTAPILPRSWTNISPAFPDATIVQAIFGAYFLLLTAFTLLKLRAAIVSQRIEPALVPRIKLLIAGLCTMGALLVLDFTLYAVASICTVSFGLIGFLAVCFPAALALGEQIVHTQRLREALSKYVSPQVTREIMERGLLLEGRECEVTALFADIRDFTRLAQELGPKQTTLFLSDYLNRMTDVIFRHHGMLIQTVGDGILAVFGAAGSPAEHELGAVRAALDMLAAVEDINRSALAEALPAPLRIGIGLHSGRAVVGNVGGKDHVDYRVTGSVVNIASRVERHTKTAGEALLVSHVTHAEVAAYVDAEPAGEAPIRGDDWTIPVFAVRGLKTAEYAVEVPDSSADSGWPKAVS